MWYRFMLLRKWKTMRSRSSTSKVSFLLDESLNDRKNRKPMKRKSSSAAARSTAAKRRPSSKSAFRASSTSSPSMSSERLCASCGRTGLQLRRVTRSFGSGETLLVIEGIPMWSCPQCGESYFTAETMHHVDRIKTLRKSLAEKRPVAVAAYEGKVA